MKCLKFFLLISGLKYENANGIPNRMFRKQTILLCLHIHPSLSYPILPRRYKLKSVEKEQDLQNLQEAGGV